MNPFYYLSNESLTIYGNTTDVEMLGKVNSIVETMVEPMPTNVCYYNKKTGLY